MRRTALIAAFILVPWTAYGKCVVEILDREGNPLGHVFTADRCAPAMARCESRLTRLQVRGAHCEITLDIGYPLDYLFPDGIPGTTCY